MFLRHCYDAVMASFSFLHPRPISAPNGEGEGVGMTFKHILTIGAVGISALGAVLGCNKKDEGKKNAAPAPSATDTIITSKSSPDDESDAVGGDDSATPTTMTSPATETGADDPTDTIGDNDNPPGADETPWEAGEGLEACAAKGVAWKAVVDGGPGQCSTQKLVPWCCTQENILAHFPAVAAQLTTKFNEYKNLGLKLYQCSEEADQSFFHFAQYDGGAISYKYVFVKAKAASNVPDVNPCPKVTSADLGIPVDSNDNATTTSPSMSTMTNTSSGT